MGTVVDNLLAEIGSVVTDERVLRAIAVTPRERFVPEALRAEAWANVPLPIGGGQTISQPQMVGVMCQALRLRGDETVLDVGTGSGYHAAVLARLARRVVSVERDPALSAQAAENLRAAGVDGVQLHVGDGTLGHPLQAPYAAINVAAASAGAAPPELVDQLADRGRMVIPEDDGSSQLLVLLQRRGRRIRRETIGPVRFVPLVGRTVEE